MLRRRFVLIPSLAAILFLATSASPSLGQKVRARVSNLAAVPTPQSVLGFTPGDDRTVADWNQITDYFARLDKASDRVLVQTLGQSTLKRPLIVA